MSRPLCLSFPKVAGLLLASLCATGCVTGSDALVGGKYTQTRDALVAAMDQRYPESFNAIHRATLTVRGRQFILDGFIRVDRGEFRTIAANSFGTTLFEIRGDGAGNNTVVRNDPSLDSEALRAGPGRDIHTIYFARPAPSDELIQLRNNAYAIVGERPGGMRIEFEFDPVTRRCMSITERRNIRPVRRISFGEYTAPDDAGCSYPQKIRIENPRGRYRVDIRVASVTPGRPGV